MSTCCLIDPTNRCPDEEQSVVRMLSLIGLFSMKPEVISSVRFPMWPKFHILPESPEHLYISLLCRAHCAAYWQQEVSLFDIHEIFTAWSSPRTARERGIALISVC